MAFDVDRSLIFLGPSRSKNDVTIHGAVTQDRSWQASCLVPAVKDRIYPQSFWLICPDLADEALKVCA
jgi:hypothetical protein